MFFWWLQALTSNDLTGSPHLDDSIWLLSLMATGQPYRKKDVDNVGVLSLAHQAKSFLTKKLFQETKEKILYDGPGMFHTSIINLSGLWHLIAKKDRWNHSYCRHRVVYVFNKSTGIVNSLCSWIIFAVKIMSSISNWTKKNYPSFRSRCCGQFVHSFSVSVFVAEF